MRWIGDAGPRKATMSNSSPQHCQPGAEREECAICQLFELFGRRWTVAILHVLLREDSVRFNELKRRIGEPSARVLSDRLDSLSDRGLVERVDHDTQPPKVTYHLTDKGRGLEHVLEAYREWADEWTEAG